MSALRLRHPADREIARLAVPALGALIADPLVSLVDTAFVGRLGVESLGALGVAAQVFGLAFFTFNFLEYGTTSVVARRFGAGDVEGAGAGTVAAYQLAAVLGVMAAVLMAVGAPALVGLMGASGEGADLAVTYLRIRALAIPAMLVIRAGHGAFRGYQDTKTPLRVSLALNGVNLILDPVLIFGLDMGIAGAAWATVAAQWFGGMWFVGLILGGRGARLGVRRLRPDPADMRQLVVIGRDLFIRSAALVGSLVFAARVATVLGTAQIAAHQVVFQVWIFLALSADAVAIAAQAMVGRALGAGATGREIADRILVLGIAVGSVLALALAALAPWLPGWFTSDVEVLAGIDDIYIFLVLLQPLGGAVFAWDGVFLGAADFTYLASATLGSGLVAVVVLALVEPFGWGLPGVWWGITALLAVRLVTLAGRRWRGPLGE